MSERLTTQEAYAAMYAFLEDIYKRTEADDLGALLGGMSLLEDGGTADPAHWAEWQAAVRMAKNHKVNVNLDIGEHLKTDSHKKPPGDD